MAVLIGLVVILLGLVGCLIGWLIVAYNRVQKYERMFNHAIDNLADYKADEQIREVAVRKDAIARSTRVVKGKVAEHLVPFGEGFGFNPRDCRFIGAPVDFLVLDGMTEGTLERIVFVEVKTGASKLSKRERQIRDAVKFNEIVFLTCRVGQDGSVEWSS